MNNQTIDELQISFYVAGRWQDGNGLMDLRVGKNRRQGERRCADRRVGDRREVERRNG